MPRIRRWALTKRASHDAVGEIKKLNENFSKQVEDLQKLYEGYMKDKEAAEAALKGQGLGLAKAVRKSLEAKTDEL